MTSGSGKGAKIPSLEDMLEKIPPGPERLTMALHILWEKEDWVLARTQYLSENSSAREMPRYVRLKQYILGDLQDDAIGREQQPIRQVLLTLPIGPVEAERELGVDLFPVPERRPEEAGGHDLGCQEYVGVTGIGDYEERTVATRRETDAGRE